MQHVATLILIGLLNYAGRQWLAPSKMVTVLLVLATAALANAIAQPFAPGIDGFAYSAIAALAIVLLATKES